LRVIPILALRNPKEIERRAVISGVTGANRPVLRHVRK
jgi:hypothetical protein